MWRTNTAGPAKYCSHCGHWCDDAVDVIGEVVEDEASLTVDSRKVDMRRLEVEPAEEVEEVEDFRARIMEESVSESCFLPSGWFGAHKLLS